MHNPTPPNTDRPCGDSAAPGYPSPSSCYSGILTLNLPSWTAGLKCGGLLARPLACTLPLCHLFHTSCLLKLFLFLEVGLAKHSMASLYTLHWRVSPQSVLVNHYMVPFCGGAGRKQIRHDSKPHSPWPSSEFIRTRWVPAECEILSPQIPPSGR